MGVGACPVVRRWAADLELLGEHPVDAAPGSLDEARALECVRKQRTARMGRCDEQVVQPDAAWEASRAGDLQPVLAPLHVDGTTQG
jgi:hypothetical protein